ncbi:MAG: ATP-dependent nuclease [Fusobacteriaceae bacterium]
MKLTQIKIENWKSIKHTHLLLNNLLILIGANNSGKSALNSALIFLLNPQSFNVECMGEKTLPLKVEGVFLQEEREMTLSLFRYDCSSPFIYRKNGEIITLEEYREFLGDISILHIDSDIFHLSASINHFLGKLKEKFPDFNVIQKSPEFLNKYVSPALFRNLLLQNMRDFLKYLQDNNLESDGDIYIIFEHPEMFLVPHEERELYNCFIELSKRGFFISIETHSSRFVGLRQYASICSVKKIRDYSSFFQYRGNLFSGDEVKNFNMNYWINSDRGELFFSRKVILVEGQTDKILLGYLAEVLEIFRYDYCIVECGSKSLLPQFIKLLNSFRIHYVAVYDRDNHKWRSRTELESSNHKNRQIHHAVDPTLGEYVEFHNDIEEEIYCQDRERKNYRNKPFIALQYVMSEEFQISSPLKKKVEKIYSDSFHN